MKVTVDQYSGFCFGVVYAIEMAEEILKTQDRLYCLGDIVHNNREIDRLKKLGLQIITHKELEHIFNTTVLIRAHGEPPETYALALKNNIKLLDASCPVVLKLQRQIKEGYEKLEEVGGQIVIFGKEGHAEVQGLLGQTKGKAIIIASIQDLHKIDFSKPLSVYSQTTKNPDAYKEIIQEIEKRLELNNNDRLGYVVHDTLCRQVSGREPQLTNFSNNNDVIVFVSGKKSSNGKMLFKSCKKQNKKSYFISNEEDIKREWFVNANSVGVCGATSTPRWLMESVKETIEQILPN